MADGSPSMLWRALLALVVGCLAIVVACTDDATDLAPELQEQQAAVEVEQEVEQQQQRSTERRGAAPAPASDGEGGRRSRELRPTRRQPSRNGRIPNRPSRPSRPNKSRLRPSTRLPLNPHRANPTAETSQQSATEEPSEAQAEPEASESRAQSQRAAARPEAQPEPQPEQEAPTAENNAQDEAEESHVAQAPAIVTDADADADAEEEQTERVASTPVGSDDNVGWIRRHDPGRARRRGAARRYAAGGVGPDWRHTDQQREYLHLARRQVHQDDHTPSRSDSHRGCRGRKRDRAKAGRRRAERLAAGLPVRHRRDDDPAGGRAAGVGRGVGPGDASNGSSRTTTWTAAWCRMRTFTTNAYFIETEPGFPSLNLANELAGQDGVVLSSPNWQTEVELQ